ncbi:MAG: cytochrome c [Planctomycetota bacterium]|nr:cytochrome c [Planctomycetaceae bacterium]MDQ3329892.1 cytochrome c [Planctomycetota bacterium]
MPSWLQRERSTKPATTKVVLAALLTTIFVAGCGRAPAPQFTPSEATLTLMPEVRDGITVDIEGGEGVRFDGVSDLLTKHFGTPTDPTVWTALPIDFGGEPASVTKVISPSAELAAKADQDEVAAGEITIAVEIADGKSVKSLPAGSQAAWTKGKYKGQSHRVTAFDPKSGAVTLSGEFDEGLPKPGDKLLLAAGGTLTRGQELYARHCIHCHGPGGAGDGPTARYLDPKPRDYRPGKYKFTSTAGPEKASSADLLDTLKRGIPGTSMPAFRMLSNDDLHALVEYVRWLSIRGDYEYQLASTVAAFDFTREAYDERIEDGDEREEILEDVKSFLEDVFPDEAEIIADGIIESWEEADDPSAIVVPTVSRVEDTPESRLRGRALYLSEKAKCATCHGTYGKGDGPQAFAYQPDSRTKQNYPLPGLYDDWHNPIRPRDLTQGVYRGGRRPIDVFRRIHAGIKGTPMPRFAGSLTEEEIWDIVNYVLHAPYEPVPEPGRGTSVASSGH